LRDRETWFQDRKGRAECKSFFKGGIRGRGEINARRDSRTYKSYFGVKGAREKSSLKRDRERVRKRENGIKTDRRRERERETDERLLERLEGVG